MVEIKSLIRMNENKTSLLCFIATALGYVQGGINSLNFDLICNLGKSLTPSNFQVMCIVCQEPSKKYLEIAENNNVYVSSLNKCEDNFQLDTDKIELQKIIEKCSLKISETFFLGHDIYTGEIASYLSRIFSNNSKSVIFHHMDYEAYYNIKGSKSPEELYFQLSKQKWILNQADILVGIGPKLTQSAKRIAPNKAVFTFIPGFPFFKARERRNVDYRLITFGRYDEKTDRLKQMGLVVAGFTVFGNRQKVLNRNNLLLKVIGISTEDESNSLKSISKKYNKSGKFLNIICIPYEFDRDRLFEEIKNSNIGLVLSYYEGFSLVGYEIIANQTPLVLSTNTGLYDFLVEIFKTKRLKEYGIIPIKLLASDSININSKDVTSVAKSIIDVYNNRHKYDDVIRRTRNFLLENYSWELMSRDFITKLLNNDNSHEIENSITSITTEELQKIIQNGINLKGNFKILDKQTYIERKTIQNRLIKLLTQNNLVFVTGEHGVGKSSLVKKVVFDNNETYDRLLWIDFYNSFEKSLVQSVLKNCDIELQYIPFDISYIYSLIIDKLKKCSGKNILVVDNVDNLKLLELLIKELDLYNWKIIITSVTNTPLIPSSSKILVGNMNIKEAKELFTNIVGTNDSKTIDFKKIFPKKTQSPIYISTIAHYLKINKVNGNINNNVIVKLNYSRINNGFSLNAFYNFLINDNLLEFTKNEKELIFLFSLLPSNYENQSIVKSILKKVKIRDVDRALNKLIESGWVNEDLQMHFLRQSAIHQKKAIFFSLRVINTYAKYLTECLIIKLNENPLTKIVYQPLANELIEKTKDIKNLSLTSLINKLGIIEFDLGNLEKSLELQMYAVQNTKSPKLYYDSLFQVGLIKERYGEYVASISYLKKAEKKANSNIIDLIEIQSKICVVYGKQYKKNHARSDEFYHNAISYYKIVMRNIGYAIKKKLILADEPNLATFYIDIAAVLSNFNTYKKNCVHSF